MKLTLIGGAGIRAPLVIQSALRRAEKIHVEEICLMDTDADQLEIISKICQMTVKQAGSPIRLTHTTDPRRALEGSDYVITTIRVGKEKGRVLDERIALSHHVLGQETTGPGGICDGNAEYPCHPRLCRVDGSDLSESLDVQFHQSGRSGDTGVTG